MSERGDRFAFSSLVKKILLDLTCNTHYFHLFYKGLIYEEDINSFNLPIYTPCTDELKAIIESESSFAIDIFETFEVNWEMRDENEILKSEDSSGKFIANTTRAVMESLLCWILI